MCKPNRNRKTIFRFRFRFLEKNRTLCAHKTEKGSFFVSFFGFGFKIKIPNRKTRLFFGLENLQTETEKQHWR